MKYYKYFYIINYNSERDKELCDLEMKAMFNYVPDSRYVLSDINVDPSRSAFIKEKINIMYADTDFQVILDKITEDKLALDKFKVLYLKSGNNDVEYRERLKAVSSVGYIIEGFPDIHEPESIVALSKIDDTWIFGMYEKNDFKWHIHDRRPYSYSNALSLKVAKTLVNIAVGTNYNTKLVDPCCGVGTVVLEALDLGIDVKGYELNELIANNAMRNLEFFGFPNVIENKDMHDIDEQFDVAIIDMPYGLFSETTEEKQNGLIKSSANFANKLILVSVKNMDEEILKSGYKITDKCTISKNQFKRYITICEK